MDKRICEFKEIIQKIESDLFDFYGFVSSESAANYLIPADEAEEKRGAVLMLEDNKNEELFIGIKFGPSIIDTLLENDPFQKLDDTNLDAFCVVAEEISHFHLIFSRAITNRELSQLEIEWQGEVDKLLLSAFRLQEQCGNPHLLPLARKLFDEAKITGQNSERYWQATKFSAKFWFNLISSFKETEDLKNSPNLKEFFRKIYASSWQEKLNKISISEAA